VQHLSKPPLALTVTAAFLAASVDGLFHVSLDRRHIRLARLRGAVELRRRTVRVRRADARRRRADDPATLLQWIACGTEQGLSS
jgi:hypothetical protein